PEPGVGQPEPDDAADLRVVGPHQLGGGVLVAGPHAADQLVERRDLGHYPAPAPDRMDRPPPYTLGGVSLQERPQAARTAAPRIPRSRPLSGPSSLDGSADRGATGPTPGRPRSGDRAEKKSRITCSVGPRSAIPVSRPLTEPSRGGDRLALTRG